MSAQRRRPQQAQQQYAPSYQQQYVHESGYTQHGAAPWQAAQSYQHQQPHPQPQPQQYYYNQQCPQADNYAFANNTQASAPSSPYPQHVQYQSAPYYPQQQPYASPNASSYQNVAQAAYPQGAYLAADQATHGDYSPNHFSPGSLSSGLSPKPSAGRSRLNNFLFPSQGTSPSLEAQVAHLSLEASAAGLPNKPASAAASSPYYAGSASGSLTASGMAHSSQFRPLSSNTPTEHTLAPSGESRSEISLRYPELPPVPVRPSTPPSIHAGSGQSDADPSTHALEPYIVDYISSLRSIINTYKQRDEFLRLRTEAVGFQPKQVWLAWQTSRSSQETERSSATATNDDNTTVNSILGVRLLQRLDKLQRENDELGRLLASNAGVDRAESAAAGSAPEVEELRKEVQDCHRLIEAMDQALSSVEARAAASERALEVACRNNSTSMLPTSKQGVVQSKQDGSATIPDSEERKPSSATPKASHSGTRIGSKALNTASSHSANGGGGGGGGKSTAQQQQRKKQSNATKGEGRSSQGAARSATKSATTPAAESKTGKGQHPPSSSSTAATAATKSK